MILSTHKALARMGKITLCGRFATGLLIFLSSCSTPMRIRDNVHDRLHALEGLGKHEIEVEVRGNDVALEGYVSSFDDKERVVSAVKGASGVDEIIDNLTVTGERAGLRENAVVRAIHDQIKAKLTNTSYSIDVIQKDGTVYLRGETQSESDKKAAQEAAQHVAGDLKIINEIRVRTESISDSQITQNVLGALQSEQAPGLEGVSLSTIEGVVHVKGAVKNHREIDRILSIALMVPGVKSVRSDVKISGNQP
ncbi:MAG: BON domain-containing protein [Deltaproteobacteria bacterium]|nr:BON domain-containing protein [Deltaproteobacteria bacterium]